MLSCDNWFNPQPARAGKLVELQIFRFFQTVFSLVQGPFLPLTSKPEILLEAKTKPNMLKQSRAKLRVIFEVVFVLRYSSLLRSSTLLGFIYS